MTEERESAATQPRRDTIWGQISGPVKQLTHPQSGLSIGKALESSALHNDDVILDYSEEHLVGFGILPGHAVALRAELKQFRGSNQDDDQQAMAVNALLAELYNKRAAELSKIGQMGQTPANQFKFLDRGGFFVSKSLDLLFKRFGIKEKYFPPQLCDIVMNCIDNVEDDANAKWGDLCDSDVLRRASRVFNVTTEEIVGPPPLGPSDSVFCRGRQTRVQAAEDLKRAYQQRYQNDVWEEMEPEAGQSVWGEDTHLHPNAWGDKADVTFFFDVNKRVVMYIEIASEKNARMKEHVMRLYGRMMNKLSEERGRTHFFAVLIRGTTTYQVLCLCRVSYTWKIWTSELKPMYSPTTRRCLANVVLSILTASSPHQWGMFEDLPGWKFDFGVGIGGESYVIGAKRVEKSKLYDKSNEYVFKFYKSRDMFESAQWAYKTLEERLGWSLANKADHCFDVPYEMDSTKCYGVFDRLSAELDGVRQFSKFWQNLATDMSEQLHAKGYIHCDACVPNILWDGKYGRLRLTDLGSLRCFAEEEKQVLTSVSETARPEESKDAVADTEVLAAIQMQRKSRTLSLSTHPSYAQPKRLVNNPGYDQVTIMKSIFRTKGLQADEDEMTHIEGKSALSTEKFYQRVAAILNVSVEPHAELLGSSQYMDSVDQSLDQSFKPKKRTKQNPPSSDRKLRSNPPKTQFFQMASYRWSDEDEDDCLDAMPPPKPKPKSSEKPKRKGKRSLEQNPEEEPEKRVKRHRRRKGESRALSAPAPVFDSHGDRESDMNEDSSSESNSNIPLKRRYAGNDDVRPKKKQKLNDGSSRRKR